MKTTLLLIATVLITTASFSQTTPELVFQNPVLVSGTAKADNAIYRFSNVSTNPALDALVKIVSRSSTAVVLNNIDVSNMGYNKAFQPELGIPGTVASNTSWWMKFEISFVAAGTNTLTNVEKFIATALDIDGDGGTLAENITMNTASSVIYYPNTRLIQPAIAPVKCAKDNIISLPKICTKCLGKEFWINSAGNKVQCNDCKKTGFLFSACNHDWTGADYKAFGTSVNAVNIDTAELRNMAMYTYHEKSSITVTYGAINGGGSGGESFGSTDSESENVTGAEAETTAGMRLNSLWFKGFESGLGSESTLPVILKYFSATLKSEVVSLKWEASVEDNFSHYIVQRSYDGNDYSDIATVFGINTPGFMNYSFTDAAVNTQKSAAYYRLLMVDKDGKTKYSDIKIIRFGTQKENLSITAFPNPVVNELRISIPNSWQGKNVRFEIFNTSGQVVKSVNNNSAGQTETISVNNLTKGFYVVKASNGTETAQQSIIKK